MIFRYNIYNSLDHWAPITHFYFKQGASWTKFSNLPIHEHITIEDLDTAHKFLFSNTKIVNDSTDKDITRPYSYNSNFVFIIATNDVEGIFLKEKTSASQSSDYHILVINLETLTFLKHFLFESGIFKYVYQFILDSIKKDGTNLGGIDNPIPVCSSCSKIFCSFMEHMQNANQYKQIKSIAEKIAYSHDPSSRCGVNLNYMINRAIASRSLTISKMLSSVDLNIKDRKIPNIAMYSDNLHVAFHRRTMASDSSKYQVILLNKNKDILMYKDGKVVCPYSHYDPQRNYEESCKYIIPSGKDIVKLYSVKYEYYEKDSLKWMNDENEYPVFGTVLPYVVEDINNLKNEFCKSNTKKIKINKALMEQLNVKRNF